LRRNPDEACQRPQHPDLQQHPERNVAADPIAQVLHRIPGRERLGRLEELGDLATPGRLAARRFGGTLGRSIHVGPRAARGARGGKMGAAVEDGAREPLEHPERRRLRALEPGFLPEDQTGGLTAAVIGAVAAQALEVDGVTQAASAETPADRVAGLVGAAVDAELEPAEAPHLGHVREPIELAPLVEGCEDLDLAAHTHDLARPEREDGAELDSRALGFPVGRRFERPGCFETVRHLRVHPCPRRQAPRVRIHADFRCAPHELPSDR
jgi:hypothetical protein